MVTPLKAVWAINMKIIPNAATAKVASK